MKQRNPVARYAQRSGAGKHKDKRRQMSVQMHDICPLCGTGETHEVFDGEAMYTECDLCTSEYATLEQSRLNKAVHVGTREPVRIEWVDEYADWPYFWLLEMRGEWVKLQGRDDPSGGEHDAGVFWVHCSEIDVMEVEL